MRGSREWGGFPVRELYIHVVFPVSSELGKVIKVDRSAVGIANSKEVKFGGGGVWVEFTSQPGGGSGVDLASSTSTYVLYPGVVQEVFIGGIIGGRKNHEGTCRYPRGLIPLSTGKGPPEC